MSKRNTTVEIFQGLKFKFQKLMEKWGGLGHPKRPTSESPGPTKKGMTGEYMLPSCFTRICIGTG